MRDPFQNQSTGLTGPLNRSAAIVPSDTDEIEVSRAILVVTGGTIVFRLRDDAEDRTLTVPDLTLLPFRVRAVRATGTDAGGILALY